VAVSDGSFKDGQGTTAWMFHDSSNPKTSLGEGALTTPGAICAQGSYRSKLSGIYGIVITINVLAMYYQQPHGSILIVCDGEAVLQKCM